MKIEEIKDVVNAMSKTSYGFIQIKHEGTEITLSNEPVMMSMPTTTTAPQKIKEEAVQVAQKANKSKEVESICEDQSESVQDNYYIVKSPLVGTFYEASSPEAGPYVKVGDQVKVNDTLCIIEAMKLMNDITAEVEGEIVEVLISNEANVEYGQPLFKIKEN